jgi:hypothetical protein
VPAGRRADELNADAARRSTREILWARAVADGETQRRIAELREVRDELAAALMRGERRDRRPYALGIAGAGAVLIGTLSLLVGPPEDLSSSLSQRSPQTAPLAELPPRSGGGVERDVVARHERSPGSGPARAAPPRSLLASAPASVASAPAHRPSTAGPAAPAAPAAPAQHPLINQSDGFGDGAAGGQDAGSGGGSVGGAPPPEGPANEPPAPPPAPTPPSAPAPPAPQEPPTPTVTVASGTTPGHGGIPPGHGGVPPGLARTPPGQGGLPPGHGPK